MSITYENIYHFEVIERIKSGEAVYMTDREKMVVESVTDMEVGDFVSVLAMAEKEKNRFDFWVKKCVEENAE